MPYTPQCSPYAGDPVHSECIGYMTAARGKRTECDCSCHVLARTPRKMKPPTETVTRIGPVYFAATWLNHDGGEERVDGWLLKIDAERFGRWVVARGLAVESIVLVEPYGATS